MPALKVAVPPLLVAPVVFHLTAPERGWFAATMIGVAVIAFAPKGALHAFGQTLTRPTRSLFEEQAAEGLDERASSVFYLSLLGLVAAPMISMAIDLPGVKTGCTLTAVAMLFVMGRQLYLTPRFRPIWRVASLFGGCLALWLTVTVSGSRLAYYENAASHAEARSDDAAARQTAP